MRSRCQVSQLSPRPVFGWEEADEIERHLKSERDEKRKEMGMEVRRPHIRGTHPSGGALLHGRVSVGDCDRSRHVIGSNLGQNSDISEMLERRARLDYNSYLNGMVWYGMV